MRLLPVPDASGTPFLWINADHLVSVQPIYRNDGVGVVLAAELKVDGMPLQRVSLDTHNDLAAAQAAFARFLVVLQG